MSNKPSQSVTDNIHQKSKEEEEKKKKVRSKSNQYRYIMYA